MHQTYILKDSMPQSAYREDSPGAFTVPTSESTFFFFLAVGFAAQLMGS